MSVSPISSSETLPTTIARRLRQRWRRIARDWLNRVLFPDHLPSRWRRSLLTCATITLVSGLIGLIKTRVEGDLVALLYVLVILWLAAAFGRGAAGLGALLASLEYDFFFVPPLHQFTVSDLSGGFSLVALLITGLVVGNLIVALRARQQHAEALYRMVRLVAAAVDQDQTLIATLARQIVAVFGPFGVRACALRAPAGQAEAGLDDIALAVARGDASAINDHLEVATIPLRGHAEPVGELRLVGAADALRALARADERDDETARFFTTYREHLALALDRLRLRHTAVHAEALRESDRLKTALLGTVSHELRTPLAAIRAHASNLLALPVSVDTAVRAPVESIASSAARLERMVGNLLDLSRLEAGVAPLDRQWYPVEYLVAAVRARLELTGALEARTLTYAAPDELPLVCVDRSQMEQVLINLVENAAKYSPPGSPIFLSAELVTPARSAVVVRVTDSGVGVPLAERDAIFTKFYRARQPLPWSDREPSGSGLGLAICAAIVQAHGGRIMVASAPGGGATFSFTVPLPDDRPSGGLPELPEAALHGGANE